MRQKRIWLSALVLIVLFGAMYALNTWSMRPKPAPDVELEGRLAHQNDKDPLADPALEGEGSGQTPDQPSTETTDSAGDDGAPLTEAVDLSDEEKKLSDEAKGSLVKLATDKGDIYLDLYDDKTPVTVGSFLDLVGTGFYDGLTFHRVIPNFMIQGGDPRGDGTGGPGFTIPDEADKGLKHARGSLSMAKTAMPNTGGSQFFVCHAPQPHLDGIHTVFGECVKGMDVVDSIVQGDKIKTATILKKSDAADADVEKAKAARVPE